ncbi:MAG: 2-amino-4-hydroxy-6-hydroxymethyldihydropteridine diphosphokinase [bacterium]
MSIAYIGLGSNIGDRLGYIQQSCKMLNDIEGIQVVECSSFYETEPFGYKEQEWFVNAIVIVKTELSAENLLDVCADIEKRLGRDRQKQKIQWGPRTVDLDILFFDDKIISTSFLQVPHPRVHLRAYALVPLLEIAANYVHPVLKKTIEKLHDDLENPEEVYLYGTRRI